MTTTSVSRAAVDGEGRIYSPQRPGQHASPATSQIWGIEDVSAYLGIPVKTIYQWRMRHYGPPARMVGRYLRFKRDDVIAWFENLDTAA
jgi:excisionase family DNA binding protein